MRIIDTIKNFKFLLVVFIFSFLILPLLSGCSEKSKLVRAKDYTRQSEDYYQAAVGIYKDLIKQDKDLDSLYLELGLLYYRRGEFELAKEAFKNSREQKAKKFLAISYYRLNNFTDALEVFSRNDIPDDEYLYYYGLTCEKLNLFDQALKAYNKIKARPFKAKAEERSNIIEKQANLISLKEKDPRLFKILQNAAGQEQYPQAGALILKCDERIEITSQNTQVSQLHYLLKILNERGKQDFSETQIAYDSTFEKVELEYARTIKPDGTIVDVGTRHIRDVSKYLNFPLYSNVRVFIISFPEVMEGAVIEYKLKIYNFQLINKKDFVIAYLLQAREPIIAADFSVSLPKERALHIKTINDKYNDFQASLSPQKEQREESLIYSWQFKDIPQIIPEPNMPADVEINPTLLISTFNSWQEIYDWWWQLAKDKISADAAIKNKVRELVRGEDSEEEKIRAIYNFCAEEIRYVAVEYGQAGYEPHFAFDIFKNKYGDCKDQAILLVTMLKEAGLPAWPVLIATREYYNLHEDFPSMLFNHVIAAVYLKDKFIFLDPTAQTCPFGDLPADDQQRKVLIIQADSYKIEDTPLYSVEHNLIKQYLKININNDESISAQKSIFTFGVYDQAQRYWLLYTQPELIQQTLKEKIQEISIGAKLIKYNIKNLENLNKPIVLNYDFQGPEYLTVAGDLRIMPQLASIDTSLVAKDKRRFAIDFNVLDTRESYLEIEIPHNFAIKYIPASLTEDSAWLRFTVEYNHKNNKLYFRQKSELKKHTVLESEYLDFKHYFEALAKKIKQRIVLERIK